jgi:hypothetical protein
VGARVGWCCSNAPVPSLYVAGGYVTRWQPTSEFVTMPPGSTMAGPFQPKQKSPGYQPKDRKIGGGPNLNRTSRTLPRFTLLDGCDRDVLLAWKPKDTWKQMEALFETGNSASNLSRKKPEEV